MFSKDTVIKMLDGHSEEIGRLATLIAGVGLVASTKTGAGPSMYTSLGEGASEIAALTTAQGECMELVTSSGRKVKCAVRAKVCLHGGGFTYAEESNQATVDTEDGPETIVHSIKNGESAELVSVRLGSVHAVNANGLWFLVD